MGTTVDGMHFRALDADFATTDILDTYESIIWTENFNEVGDFEIAGGMTDQLLNLIATASYIWNSVTSTLMVIEKQAYTYDKEDGSTLVISGRSLLSVLNRRIISRNTTIIPEADMKISSIICQVVSDAFSLLDAGSDRHWDRLILDDQASSTSAKLLKDKPMQFGMGENVLDVVLQLCAIGGLGVKMEYSQDDGLITFIVYEGEDLTAPGEEMILFSDLYDNLSSGKSEFSTEAIKNTMLVIGNAEDPETQIPLAPVTVGDASTGLERRETFFQAEQSNVVYVDEETSTVMPLADYEAALVTAGTQELVKPEYQSFRGYEGSIIESANFRLQQNYNIGDYVLFGIPHLPPMVARLTGITFSADNTEGNSLSPHFDYSV